ncbi:MAG: sensor histidine kinase, partial [Sphingomonadales bacterium]|nr:sensor histidine kinase [Sphingomonadales bacterium]
MLQAAGWSGYLLLRVVVAVSNAVPVEGYPPIFIEAIVGYCLTLLLSTLYGYYRRQPRWRAIVLTVATLLIATLVYSVIQAFNVSFLRPGLARGGDSGISWALVIGSSFIPFTVLTGWTSLYFGINWYLIVEEQVDRMHLLESEASSAQLAMLRYQLNPHFLFNTLNSISTLVLLKETQRANAMLSRLSAFLRYTLANEPTAHVTVLQE